MKKRLISLLVTGALSVGTVAGLTACGGGSSSNTLTVWGPSEQQTMLTQMIASFKEENPDFSLEIKTGVCSEADAYANLSTDVKAGADVFAYANDQLINLYTAGALAQLGPDAQAKIIADNDAGSVSSAKIGDGYYGYPYASDNGFFMFYNKDIISDEQAENLEDVMAQCAANGKYFIFDIDNSWYVGSFIYGVGGTYELVWDGATIEEVKCDFTKNDTGKLAGEKLVWLNGHNNFINGDDNTITTYLKGDKFGACISGTWKAAEIEKELGDNYGATRCPDFTTSDGETHHMVAFSGYKLYGVNKYSSHLAEAHQLAAYLSGEAMQDKRFDDFQIGPSNKVVAAKEKVQQNVALAALNLQLQPGYFMVQESLPSSYWTAMEAFGTDIANGATTNSNVADKVAALQAALIANA